MPVIVSTAQTAGLDFERFTFADADWETFTFPDWVSRVALRTLAGTLYVSRVATGTFVLADTNYLTLLQDNQWIVNLHPGASRFPTITRLQLAHSDGATGVVEIEMLA